MRSAHYTEEKWREMKGVFSRCSKQQVFLCRIYKRAAGLPDVEYFFRTVEIVKCLWLMFSSLVKKPQREAFFFRKTENM